MDIDATHHAALVQQSDLLSAMGNPSRLAVLRLLASEELPVGILAKKVGLSQSALSQHLAKLRKKKLVSSRRDAQTIYYSCKSKGVQAILATLDGLADSTPRRLSA